MNFDPAIAAQQALQQAEKNGELGDFASDILEAEDTFSTDQGPEAKQAYEELQSFGLQLPDAKWFQEFLIYITWQQVTEGPLPRYFQHGLDASNRFLEKFGKDIQGTPSHQQILAIRESFREAWAFRPKNSSRNMKRMRFKAEIKRMLFSPR